MKLPACRNLARAFFMIHSDPDCDGRVPKLVNPLAPLRRSKVAQRLADRGRSERLTPITSADQGFMQQGLGALLQCDSAADL
jgi:hypothetical protein